MTDEIKGAVAEALIEQSSGQNISPQAFANRRIKQLQPEQPKEEAKEEVSEQVEETEVEETETEATKEVQEVAEVEEETTEEATTEEVLSQYNLDEMSEQDLKELGEKLGSRAVARFGELTAKRKQAEEKLAELQNQLSAEKTNILDSKKSLENNPYSNLDTIDKIQDKAQEINEIISWAEDTLFESDGYTAEDVVTEVEGKEVTKAQVRKSLLQARKARDSFLPDQLNKIQLKETVDPDIAAQLPYILAHAANSIYGRKIIKQDKPGVTLNPPKTGATSAPKTSRDSKGKKALADLTSRFKSSGSRDDFIKLRTKQLTR
jgi:hypothetical protein